MTKGTKAQQVDAAENGRVDLSSENPEKLKHYYHQMLLIRHFEERAGEMYTKAKIGGYCHLNLGEEATPTVTGGLSLFGAPLNNYMTHATCAMVRVLRSGDAETGLLYGQGEYVTKHHALVVARRPPDMPLDDTYDLQARADSKRGHSRSGTSPESRKCRIWTARLFSTRIWPSSSRGTTTRNRV